MLPEPPVLQWLFASWLWLLREHRGRERRDLVTPSWHCFPVQCTDEELAAGEYFERVRALAGVDDWPLSLVPEDADQEPPEGIFPVCYPRWALGDPTLLVARLATGVGQQLVQQSDGGVPEDPDALEMAAELAAVFLGFGVFVANGADRIALRSEPPLVAVRPQPGVLGPRELSYALAIFAWLQEIPDDDVARHLDPNPRAFYRTATKDLRRRGKEMASLRAAGDRFQQGPYR